MRRIPPAPDETGRRVVDARRMCGNLHDIPHREPVRSAVDHLGIRDGQIYPGADDDASGVAVVLELAAFCQKTPFRHSILFAAFDAEERGLQGAKAFLEKRKPRFTGQ